MNEPGVLDPLYVRARRALLDALAALGPHRKAVILVGAQAVYLQIGEAREALSSFTIDADLALNPAELPDEPALQEALLDAGFHRKEQPGLWFTPDRLKNKDASDLFLLLRATETAPLAATLRRLRDERSTAETTKTALRYLRDLFTSDEAAGIELLRAAVAGIEDEETVARSCIALSEDVLTALV